MKLLVVICLIGFTCCFLGCTPSATAGKNVNQISSTDHNTEKDLRQSLEDFEDFFVKTISDAADKLDTIKDSRRPNRTTLKMKSLSIRASAAMLAQDEPMAALIDVWALSARLSSYFQDGHGSKSFEPNQNVAIEAARKIEYLIENIALKYLNKENFKKTRHKVHVFANANPIKPAMKDIILFATKSYKGKSNPFEEIITLPLMPLAMVNGVTEGVTGAGKISKSTDHIADIVEAFPESARWQLLMLLYDIEKLDSVKSTLGSISQFSKSTSRFTSLVDQLPEKLRLEFSELIKEIDEKSQNIHKTLLLTASASDDIKEVLETGDELTMSINRTSEKIQQAATAWQGAADSSAAAISKVIELDGPDHTNIDINTVRQAAVEFNLMAEKIPEIITQTDTLINKVTNRITFLIILIFATTFAFTVLVIRLSKRSP